MFNLITIGDSTVDTFLVIDDATLQCDLSREHCKLCLNYADKIPISRSAQSIGGDAANVAAGCRKLGLDVAVVTELGDDINGRVIKNGLKKAGINTSMVKILKNRETRYSVVLNYKSERTILSYHVTREYVLPKLPATDWIYYTSLGANFESLQDDLVKHLEKHPTVRLAINPGSHQIKNALNKIKEILPKTDILFLNKEEADRIVGKKNNIKTTLNALLNKGVRVAVVTDSYNGSYSVDDDNAWFMPVYPIKPVGKTGAGDAFASGFLSAIMLKKDIKTAMQWGTADSASVIQQIGAQKGLLDKNGIEKMIKQFTSIRPTLLS